MRRILLFVVFLLLGPVVAAAQTAPGAAVPFDMGSDGSGPPPQAVDPATPQPTTATPATPQTTERLPFFRYVIPADEMRIEGENVERSWSMYLTEEQARSAAKFNIGYQNSIFVAPEYSRLTISFNNVEVATPPLSSSERKSDMRFDVPDGVLKPGYNIVSFKVKQRHRTDCDLESTYDLWTDIDPERTFLMFDNPDAGLMSTTDDIRAVGVDALGRTQFHIVAPGLSDTIAADPLLELAQGLALLADMPNTYFTYSKTEPVKFASGVLPVYVGTPAELRPLLGDALPDIGTTQSARFVSTNALGQSVLVLVAPSWQRIGPLIDGITAPAARSAAQKDEAYSTHSWRKQDTQLLTGHRTLTFEQLGIPTQEFSGRVFRAEFAIGLPADFYADAYGEARLLLDAAYGPIVLPGSRLHVFVNDQLAATWPISTVNGAVLRRTPVRFTMRHMRPGVNKIVLEAALLTKEDAACLPGQTADDTPRFAVFDTSEFEMPNFGRVAQVPNLWGTSGTGFPYSRHEDRIPLYMDSLNSDTMSAASDFVAKLTNAARHQIPVDVVHSIDDVGDGDAIFLGAIGTLPAQALRETKVSQTSRSVWTQQVGGEANYNEAPETTIEEWDEAVTAGWYNWIFEVEKYLKRNYDLSFETLRFLPRPDTDYLPPNSISMIVAQEPSPNDDGAWTMIAAPTHENLENGMMALTKRQHWDAVQGRITTYNRNTGVIDNIGIGATVFIFDTPFSINNVRLVLTNWFSTNTMSFSLALVIGTVLLGIATKQMMTRFGRYDE
ncbi:cellulose biosynthesis cyclic di-GMP-binding regulatory protein BcsB [Martelella lutilitoris]|uniref:Cyclic di-GMP-binding protein n=1 Tax=Martelella lutilitoris TaxID=2583532 RepID=A0A5C4JX14_9HYPH|nr:cellulose biosynthesis cyclic di-GMP-binding regulatory protein BcsB [Martelella lutilitoris]TNB49209.1 cellulose biosynthesis cyclic di-GMP-binding regulatory protein BcsB [Martelella lutilitoris]